jgi:guanyl-specific ribonuclease Sa
MAEQPASNRLARNSRSGRSGIGFSRKAAMVRSDPVAIKPLAHIAVPRRPGSRIVGGLEIRQGRAMQRGGKWVVILLVLVAAVRLANLLGPHPPPKLPPAATAESPATDATPVDAAALPAEVGQTLRLIAAGGPFPYERDGVVFGNYEHRLPEQPRGYYHEYTVPTPGAHNRGARRIIAGGQPPREFWYTGDHYEHFQRLEGRP